MWTINPFLWVTITEYSTRTTNIAEYCESSIMRKIDEGWPWKAKNVNCTINTRQQKRPKIYIYKYFWVSIVKLYPHQWVNTFSNYTERTVDTVTPRGRQPSVHKKCACSKVRSLRYIHFEEIWTPPNKNRGRIEIQTIKSLHFWVIFLH